MCRVSKACCGCSLKTGTMIILWWDLLFRGFAVIAFHIKEMVSAKLDAHLAKSVLGYLLIGWFITIIALVGVIHRRSALMIPYIVLSAMILVLHICITGYLLILLACSSQIDDRKRDGDYNADSARYSVDEIITPTIPFIFNAAYFLFSYYLLCIVYSYYKELREENITRTYNRGTGIAYSAPKRDSSAEEPQPAATLSPQ